MTYKDFKESAQRHLDACYHILEYIDSSPAAHKKTKSDRLSMNVYYLSGYVIECIIKFAFFKAIDHRITIDNKFKYHKRNDDTYQYGFTTDFERNLKTHNLDALRVYLGDVHKDLSRDIPFIRQSIRNTKYKMMIDNWNSEIRYAIEVNGTQVRGLKALIVEPDLMKQYLDDVVKPIFDSLTTR